MKNPYISRTCLAMLVAVVVSLVNIHAHAQTPAATPCDPNYFDSLKARAWLEAQREITQNQNLIFKPDSVLEYTCFNRYLDVLATQAPNMFSGNTRWGSTGTNMATALQNLVANPMASYIDANFEQAGGGTYDLLGGRGNADHEAPFTVSSSGSYTCTIMNDIWMEAKCMDFIMDDTTDGFYTFDEYAGGDDKRQIPVACTAIASRWQGNIDTAFVDTATPWIEDYGNTYLEDLKNSYCAKSTPLKTGLVVRTMDGAQYDEHVCVPAGCFYDTGSGKCKP